MLLSESVCTDEHNISLQLESAHCQLFVFWFYSCIKARLPSVSVILPLNRRPSAMISLLAEEFINFYP